MTRSFLVAAAALLAVSLAGCGDDTSSSADEPQQSETTPAPAAAEKAAETPATGTPGGADAGTEAKLPSGVAYRIEKAGNGHRPATTDYVTVHFRVLRTDGELIQDSRNVGDAVTLLVSDALPGWREVLPLMDEGAEWSVSIPGALAYGEEGLGDVVKPNETLIFQIALLKVETAADYNARHQLLVKAMEKDRAMNQKYLEDNKAKPGVTTLPSGLQYEVLTAGTGKHPKPTDTVRVHYKGTLIDGTEFDSSYSRGAPAEFQVNRLIQGWQEALPLMQEGAKWRLTIPSGLAYGDRGAGAIIKPGSTLVFEMELIKVL